MTRLVIVMLLLFAVLPIVVHGDRHATAPVAAAVQTPPLRVCADPNNLPFTNQRREGFENRIAELLARDLHARIEYTWWAQRRGFLRNTLNAGRCDIVLGLPARIDGVLTTRPYYRSTYVFVTQRARHLDIRSFDDPRLKILRIGVPLVGDDGANAPPAQALSRRGVVANVVGFSVFGDYQRESPPSNLIAAVARGDVDVAVAWGPLAGFFAAREPVSLRLTPVQPPIDASRVPLVFDMSMATRRGDLARHAMLESFIERRRVELDRILADYHIPRVVPRPAEGPS
jgi:mxaJ protein